MRRKRQTNPKGILSVLALLAAGLMMLPLAKGISSTAAMPALEELTRQAAFLSVALSMPEGGIALLEERFNSELFTKDEVPDPLLETPVPSPKPSENSSSAQPEKKKDPPPEIEERYRGNISEEDLSGAGGAALIAAGNGRIRNYTKLTGERIAAELEKPIDLGLVPGGPQVLIIHTHATESYEEYDTGYYDTRNGWRSTDDSENMVAVGNALAKKLEENGIGVIHDATQHDYPSYNGSYQRSAETIKKHLAQNPSIRIMLDVHRDGIQRTDTLIVKPTTVINGRKAAQLMIIAGCDDGTMNMPGWSENLRFAGRLVDAVETDSPTLMRPVMFCYRKYNQDLAPGSLLLEFGSQANTLEEAIYTAELVGQSLADLLHELGV